MAKIKKEKKHRIKKFFGDFKTFISKGNILDLAVAVIIGSTFNAIVTSLVKDIIMPLITLALGKSNLDDLSIVLRPAQTPDGEALLWKYGAFLQTIVNFLIVAFTLFLVVKTFTKLQELGKDINNRVIQFTKKELKKLRKSGYSNEQIEEMKNAKAAVMEEVTTTTTTQQPKETTEDLLRDIKNLLASTIVKQDTKKEENN